MANPLKALFGLVAHRDNNEQPLSSTAEDSVSGNFHKEAYETFNLQVEKRQKLHKVHESDLHAKPIDNSAILQLSREERQQRFEHAVKVKLGEPWDYLARQITLCREDYTNNKGEEEPNYYRSRRFKRQTEVRMDEYPSEKFYFQAQCCARTPVNKKSLNEFAAIADYYGFGVKEKPVPILFDIELAVKEKEAQDNISPYYGGQTERGFGGGDNYFMLGVRLEDGTQYRYKQTESGQKTFRDQDGLWLCKDSNEPMPADAFWGTQHTWVLYKQAENKDVYLEQPTTKQFAIKLTESGDSLLQIFEDGTVKQITSDGVVINKPVKSGS